MGPGNLGRRARRPHNTPDDDVGGIASIQHRFQKRQHLMAITAVLTARANCITLHHPGTEPLTYLPPDHENQAEFWGNGCGRCPRKQSTNKLQFQVGLGAGLPNTP